MKRERFSIVGGGLFGFAIIQIVLIIIIASEYAPTLRAFVAIIMGLVTASTFLGGIIAGVIDKEDAFIHGAYAAIFALTVSAVVNVAIWLFAALPLFSLLSGIAGILLFFMLLIPIFLGAIGGKLGSLFRGKG